MDSEPVETLERSPHVKGRRGIVLVLVVAALSLAGPSFMRWRATQKEQAIAAQLKAAGAICQRHDGRVTQVSFTGLPISKVTARQLGKLTMLKRLVLVDCSLEDETLTQLASLPVRELVLMESPVVDKDLQILSRFAMLEYLHLSGDRITDAALKHVAEVKSLVRLDLKSIQISDQSLLQLKSLQRLRDFHLADCEVSDEALAELQRELPLTDIFVDLKRH